ncbi:flagellar protein FlaG [uncultured Campylobacter sp.]|uniref:flagellar protein FlaG n=1 Tax=uncultured Campylobacter sp. TaxID=218934 RepID=UPI0025CBD43E|nr:flagellar protein FlaG [uncultured Campylobacter sp.]
MEILKATAQTLDSAAGVSSQAVNDTRKIEKTDVEQDIIKQNQAASQKSVSQTIDEQLDKLSNEELGKRTKEAAEKLNFQMEQLDAKVRFAYNDNLNLMIVQVKDAKTGELVSELPSKQAIKISEYFKESLGILFDKES